MKPMVNLKNNMDAIERKNIYSSYIVIRGGALVDKVEAALHIS